MNMWLEATSGGRAAMLGRWVLALGPLVVACGGEGPDGALPSTDSAQAAPAEPVGVSTEALDTEGDRPVVATSPTYIPGGQAYVLAVDTSGNLQEMRYSIDPNTLAPTFGSWSRLDTHDQGVPTMHVYQDTGAVDEYVWGNDGNLWELFRQSADGPITFYNLSEETGFGPIAGSPVVVDWGEDSSEWAAGVAVTSATDGGLYTIDYTQDMGWQVHPVWNGSSVLTTDNTILSANGYTGNIVDRYFSGRTGSTSWVVKRVNGNFGGSFSVYQSFGSSQSTPYVNPVTIPPTIVARFGTQLKMATLSQGALAWTALQGCVVDGSPTWTGVRQKTTGHLLSFDGHSCYDRGEVLTSAPTTNPVNPMFYFFRGATGPLHVHEVGGANTGWSLHLSVP